MNISFDTKEHSLFVNKEEVVSIEIKKDYLLTKEKDTIVPIDNKKEPLIIYNLKGGGRWVLVSKIILDLKPKAK